MDPVRFFQQRWVDLFNRGASLLAQGGDQRRIYDDVQAAHGAAWLSFEGAADVWLQWRQGQARVLESAAPAEPVRLAVALPAEVATRWLEAGLGAIDMDSDAVAKGVARTVSSRVEELIGDQSLDFHIVITGVPQVGDTVVRVAVHGEAPSDTPGFTISAAWEDLVAAREQQLGIAQLFMAGKLKLGGDYSGALQLGMQLMQQEPL